MQYNYDTLAPIYDRLSRLVFGKALVNAQLSLIEAIPPDARILIIGGGTGWILESIAEKHPQGLSITYVDASAKMIAIARRRNAKDNKVTFINADIETATLVGAYDVVLTPFIFDNFREEELPALVARIEAVLTPSTLWLHCDFQPSAKRTHRLLIRTMYVFFRFLCGIRAHRLPNVDAIFRKRNWRLIEERAFFNGMIAAAVYTRLPR